MNLEKQIEEIGHNDKITKYEKDSKLIKLAADKKKLDIRRAQLMKDLNEGLDPNISGAEQQILDEWKKIGDKGELLEKKWQVYIEKKNPKIKSKLEKTYINSDLNELEELVEKLKKKYFESKYWLV